MSLRKRWLLTIFALLLSLLALSSPSWGAEGRTIDPYHIDRDFVWVDTQEGAYTPMQTNVSARISNVAHFANSPDPTADRGTSGLLFDAGSGCPGDPALPPTTALPKLIPSIALMHFDAAAPNNCSHAVALANVAGIGVVGVVAYAQDASADIPANVAETTLADSTILVPGLLIDAVSGMSLLGDIRSASSSTNSTSSPGPGFVEFARVTMFAPSTTPITLWEYALIIVACFLICVFVITSSLHCYIIRRRRAHLIAHGINPDRPRMWQEGGIGWVVGQARAPWNAKTILDDRTLATFPLQTYTEEDERMAKMIESDGPPEASAMGVPVETLTTAPSQAVSIHESEETMEGEAPVSASAPTAPSTTVEAEGSAEEKNIPAITYILSSCPICLEDFHVGDPLRLLPCGHRFHKACIDPWLTEKSSACPLCKRDFIDLVAGRTRPSDSLSHSTSMSTSASISTGGTGPSAATPAAAVTAMAQVPTPPRATHPSPLPARSLWQYLSFHPRPYGGEVQPQGTNTEGDAELGNIRPTGPSPQD